MSIVFARKKANMRNHYNGDVTAKTARTTTASHHSLPHLQWSQITHTHTQTHICTKMCSCKLKTKRRVYVYGFNIRSRLYQNIVAIIILFYMWVTKKKMSNIRRAAECLLWKIPIQQRNVCVNWFLVYMCWSWWIQMYKISKSGWIISSGAQKMVTKKMFFWDIWKTIEF